MAGTYEGSQNWIAGTYDAGKTSRKTYIQLTGLLSTHRVVYGFCDDWFRSDLYDLYESRGMGVITAFRLDRDTNSADFLSYSTNSSLDWSDDVQYSWSLSSVLTQYSTHARLSSEDIRDTYFNGNYTWIAM